MMKLFQNQHYFSRCTCLIFVVVVLLVLGLLAMVLQLRGVCVACDLDDAGRWAGTRELSRKDGLRLQWRLSSGLRGPQELILKLEMENVFPGNHAGWIGLGFAESSSGSMLGADIVTVRMTSGKPIVEDRYVPFSAFPMAPFPEIDDCQDWQLVSYSKGLFKWSVIIKRVLDTGDAAHDRVILPKGLNRIIWAWQRGSSDVQYHHGNRHAGTIDLRSGTIPVPQIPHDAKVTIPITHNNYEIPTDYVSHYACQGFDLGEKESHVVMIEPYVEPGHEHLVHHLLLHACGNSYPYSPIHEAGFPPKLCLNMDHGLSPLGFGGCTTLVFAWAVGGSALVLPPNTGFRIGGDAFRYLILEIHYNNPELQAQIVDNSGVIFHATKDDTSREIDATVFIVGDSQVSLPDLIPGEINHREVTCLAECTKMFTGEINVFASFLHMHNYGRQVWTMRYPKSNGSDPGEGIFGNHISFWSFDFQQITEMSYVISPGDQLSVHGVYDLEKADEPVHFGELSSEEMLFDFLFVYPKSALNEIFFCGRQYPGVSQCGKKNITGPNPIPDGMTELPEVFAKESDSTKCHHDVVTTEA